MENFVYNSARTVGVTGRRAAQPQARMRGASDRDRDMPLLQFTVDIVSWGAEREAPIHMSTLGHQPGGLAAGSCRRLEPPGRGVETHTQCECVVNQVRLTRLALSTILVAFADRELGGRMVASISARPSSK